VIVVADAGPLIALAKILRLDLLHDLYGSIGMPPAVNQELQLNSGRPGAQQLAKAVDAGWLSTIPLTDSSETTKLRLILDIGEVEAILLAEQIACRFLLIDERKGRIIASQRGIPIVGVAGVLLAAKTKGLIVGVLPLLKELSVIGYRLSPQLVEQVAGLAKE
jgi:predicted nucleic acid-binding protein